MVAGKNGKQLMVKILLIFIFGFLISSSISFAKIDDAKLKQEFGQDLTKAPFFLRFSFSKKFNKDWGQSDYLERRIFLTDYEDNLASEKAQEIADAKAEADQEKERLNEKKEAELKEKNILKAQEAEDKAEDCWMSAIRRVIALIRATKTLGLKGLGI